MKYLVLIILILFGILLSLAIDKRVEETLPPYAFLFLIFLYLLAILKKPHHAFELSFVIFAGVWGLYVIRKKRIFPKLTDIKAQLSWQNAPGFWCYLGAVAVMMYCYSNHFVNNWDDFHFNATFARDLFLYGGMPTGYKAATGYKTYKPLMQLFYDWGLQGIKSFDEPLMFQYKSFLLMTGLLPLFNLVREAKSHFMKIVVVITTVILPFSFLFEVVDSLSMDGLMGILFGYCLIAIIRDKDRDWFWYVKVMSGISALVMVKTTGIIFTGVVVGTWFMVDLHHYIADKRDGEKVNFRWLLNMIIGCIPAGVLWLSWKIFCDRNGNTTYLNTVLGADMDSAGLPSYGKETIINALKQLFTLNMNLGAIGTTFALIMLMAAVMIVVMIRSKEADTISKVAYVCVCGCAIPYICLLIYTYLFVFYDFEAYSLSSYDRYLGTYALGVMIVVFYDAFTRDVVAIRRTGVVFSGILLCTLNYYYLFNSFIPANYVSYRQELYEEKMEAKEEIEGIEGLVQDAFPIIIIGNESNTMYARAQDYYVIPMVSSSVDVLSYDADTDKDGTLI